MAVTANTVVTLDRALIKENVANMIYTIDPVATPCLSSLRRKGTKNVWFETPQDSLADPVDQSVAQGDELAFDDAPSPSKVRGYTHIMDKGILVADTARRVSTYGYSDELAYQLQKKVKELKRDMEKRLCGNYASVKPPANSAANRVLATTKTGSMASWIESNVTSLKVSATTAAVVGGYSSTTMNTVAFTAGIGGTFGVVTEQNIRDMITKIAEQQDMIGISQIICSLKNKEVLSRKLTGLAAFRKDYGKAKGMLTAVASVDMYRSDFGLHRILFNRWQPKNVIYFVDPRFWEIRYLQNFDILPIARTGHAVKRMVKVEFGLGSKHEKANGMIIDAKDGN